MTQDQKEPNPETNSPMKNASGEIESHDQRPSLKVHEAKLNK